MSHPLVITLRGLRGNARAAVATEPLWGIPYNLYAPYISVYMLALGLKDQQIGLLSSISLALQIVWSLLSGLLADKLGRRRTVLIFDLFSWSLPVLIWAAAQNFTYFLVAAILSSLWRVAMNAWTCLVVEDTDPTLLVDIYAWIYIAGLLAAFFAPVAGALINAFSLVPTMRGLYLFAFALMTAKFILMYRMSEETRQGQVRILETRRQNLGTFLKETGPVFRELLRTPATLYTGGIMVIITTSQLITNNFWGVIVTQKLHIPAEHIAFYPVARALVMLVFFFAVTPLFNRVRFKIPMLAGFGGYIVAHLILVAAPERSYLALLISTLFEACAYATLNPLLDRMVAVTVDPRERARIQSLLYTAVITLSSPFGWIAGLLSARDKSLPFILTCVLFVLGIALVLRASRLPERAASAGLTNLQSQT